MLILLMFNHKDRYTWKEIYGKLAPIPPKQLERHILALAHPKVRVLNKKPNKKILNDTDTFAFNTKYRNQRVRVNIGVLADNTKSTEIKKKSSQVPHQVLETRKNRVEAAIVRIMKARKKLRHQNLIVEVVHQLQSRLIQILHLLNNELHHSLKGSIWREMPMAGDCIII
eukprot:TRINITY_DN5572_c0_g1_i1.p1 TRINITY_DN5572_c0_g1~~TRINITY_DN5572_c0_g1_i1.p1  ORF type:complete len:170 (-),score=45.19 TRINITY_DN5572_c0_g1_i1:327-836(-)